MVATVIINVSSAPPVTVINISSTTADGTYKIGDTVKINITFSGSVDVAGYPLLHMETGDSDHDR